MEVSGNNRYGLLYMDDELSDTFATVKNNAGTGNKKTDQTAQQHNKNLKESKHHTLNKSNGYSSITHATSGQKNNTAKKISNGTKEPGPRLNARMDASEYYHSNLPEYNHELPQRQIRDREIRAPSRFRANEKFGKREFDRQSGSDKTGIKSIDKRDGAGAHNWGCAKQDIDALKSGDAAPIADIEDSTNEKSGDLTNHLEEDESKQMTLDEWKALKDQRAKPNYNLRKAGEGENNSEWKKMTVLCKKKGLDIEDELEYDPSMYPQRVGRVQRIVDIQFNFNDGRKPGFRKGLGLSARGRTHQEIVPSNGFAKLASFKFGEKRHSESKTLKVDDEMQFPNLS